MKLDWDSIKTLCRGPFKVLAGVTLAIEEGDEFWLHAGMLAMSLKRDGHQREGFKLDRIAARRDYKAAQELIRPYVEKPS